MLVNLSKLTLMHVHKSNSWEVHNLLHYLFLPRRGLLRMFVQEEPAVSVLQFINVTSELQMLHSLFFRLNIFLWI